MTFDYLCDWLKGSAAGADCQPAESRQKRKLKKKVVPFVITNFKGGITKPNIPLEMPSFLPLCACLPFYFTPQSQHETPQHDKRGRVRNVEKKWMEEVFGSRWSDAPIIYDWHVNDGKVYMLSSSVTSSFWCCQAGGEEEKADRRTASQRELLSPRLLLHSSSSLVISP